MLLALDTSTRAVGLALYDGAQVLSEAVWTSHDHHTVELAPAVAEMLEKCRAKVQDLEALAVALGPGSFTGLRIGLALAKGIALVRRIPIIGIPTLDILAAAQPVSEQWGLAAVLRAGRGRLATGWYQAGSASSASQPDGKGSHGTKGALSWQPSGKIEVFTPDDLLQHIQTPTLVCGELTEDERHLLGRKRKNVILASPAHSLRRPGFLAEIGWQRWQQGYADDPAVLSPIYLHYNEPIPG